MPHIEHLNKHTYAKSTIRQRESRTSDICKCNKLKIQKLKVTTKCGRIIRKTDRQAVITRTPRYSSSGHIYINMSSPKIK